MSNRQPTSNQQPATNNQQPTTNNQQPATSNQQPAMNYFERLIREIEVHSVQGIRECFANGVDPNSSFRGEPLIFELTSEYARGAKFKDCVRAFVDYGLRFEDDALLAVLMDDVQALSLCLARSKDTVRKKYDLRCAYTPLQGATLLHICAEFNHVACADVLVKLGADVDAVAATDQYGFGGQTPIFHTVNQNGNQSADMLNYLLSQSADLTVTVAGIIWGKGYDWETLIPSVNPLSYAMMGLLPQMHRNETTVSRTVSLLLKAAYGVDYVSPNVPCKYLRSA